MRNVEKMSPVIFSYYRKYLFIVPVTWIQICSVWWTDKISYSTIYQNSDYANKTYPSLSDAFTYWDPGYSMY